MKRNSSITVNHALRSQEGKPEAVEWLAENKEAIKALNDLAENNSLFSDTFRYNDDVIKRV